MKYETISGRIIELLHLAREQAAYLDRLMREFDRLTEAAFVALAYSSENPILDSTVMPGHGMVTARVLADPAYAVIQDLVYRKGLASRGIDPATIAAQYTLSPSGAAELLGVHVSAVRQAIASGRLATWVKDGKHWLHPDTVKAFAPERRGPKAAGGELAIVLGAAAGRVMKVKADRELEVVEKRGHQRVMRAAPGWKHLGVLTVDKVGDKERFFLIVPSASGAIESLVFDPFSVKGAFRIIERKNNSKAAREAWGKLVGGIQWSSGESPSMAQATASAPEGLRLRRA